jgi:hypothetical protein
VVDLHAASESGWRTFRGRRDVLVPSTAWLWRPWPRVEGVRGTLSLALPEAVRASLPWQRVGEHYVLDDWSFSFLGQTAFGALDVWDIEVPGARFEVARMPGETDADREDIRRWLGEAGRMVASIYGRFPVPRVQLVVVPVGPGSEPVAFGYVSRGGGASVMLLLRRDAEVDRMVSDWVAVHELTHLVLPYCRREDAWLSEGLATYYQEILRARGGAYTALEAWRGLDDGFRRGRDRATGRTLQQESVDMYRTGAFQRVYWSGTAIFLLADVALRRRNQGDVRSLDDALERLGRCCLDEPRVWTAAEVIARLDGISGTQIFSELAHQYLPSEEFPDLAQAYRFLGLRRGADGLLTLESDAEGAAVRAAITR